jgi:hypothetical protein
MISIGESEVWDPLEWVSSSYVWTWMDHINIYLVNDSV